MAYSQSYAVFQPNHNFGLMKFSLIDLEAEMLTGHKQHVFLKNE
jgi:hypothetical protein